MVDLVDLTPPSVSPSSILSLTKSSACGTNLGLDALKGLQKELDGALSGLTSASDGIFSNISSLGSSLTSNMGSLFESLKANILPELPKIPTLDLQTQFNQLLSQLALGGDITSITNSIKTNFPSFNIQDAFNKISLGQFDLCSSIPNLKIIDGKVVEEPPSCPKPTTDAKGIPTAIAIPEAKALAGTVNNAMTAAVAGLRTTLSPSLEASTRSLEGLSSMSVSTLSDSASSITESLKSRTPEMQSAVKLLEAQAAASAKVALGSIGDWNGLASKLSERVNAQMTAVFTPEKVKQLKEQLNATAATLKTDTAPLTAISNMNADSLSKYPGTNEAIQKAKSIIF